MANELEYSPLDHVLDSLQNHPELVGRGIVICDILNFVRVLMIRPSDHAYYVIDDV